MPTLTAGRGGHPRPDSDAPVVPALRQLGRAVLSAAPARPGPRRAARAARARRRLSGPSAEGLEPGRLSAASLAEPRAKHGLSARAGLPLSPLLASKLPAQGLLFLTPVFAKFNNTKALLDCVRIFETV